MPAAHWRRANRPVAHRFRPARLAPRVRGRGARDQRFARFLFRHYTAAHGAFSAADIEHFIAPFREPARARAASALYRHYITPTATRIVTGSYRRHGLRLHTPTRLLFGAEDRAFSQPSVHGGHEGYADDLEILPAVPGAAHFVADENPPAVAEAAVAFFGR